MKPALTKLLVLSILLFSLSCISFDCIGQTEDYVTSKSDSLMIITLHSGHTYVGVIKADDGREVLIHTETLGPIYIKKQDVESIKPYTENEAPVVLPNSNSLFYKKYFFNSTMIPQEKGEMNVNLGLLGPEVQAGISSGLTFGGTASWLGAPLVFQVRYSASVSETVHLGAGVNVGTLGWFNWNSVGAMPYAGITLGNSTRNFSLKGGYVVVSNDGDTEEAAVYSMGGFVKFRQKTAFVFEGIGVISNNTALIGVLPGFRIQTSNHRAFQFAVGGLIFDGEPLEVPLPYFSWQMDI